ncbi:MAG: helix-turn-helix transcriptional regulator [Candidatus Accumulibacter sp. UW20]
MSIGVRLAEERARLGISQQEFADKSGVSRVTLGRYENDRRQIGAGFIETIRSMGVDVNYVLFNIRSAEVVDCPHVARMFHPPGTIVQPISLSNCRDMATGVTLRSTGNNEGIKAWFDECQACPLHPGKLGHQQGAYLQDEDVRFLAAILEGIEEVLAARQLTMSSAKKAQAAAMLYRAFKASGKVDPAMIEEAVKLAAS